MIKFIDKLESFSVAIIDRLENAEISLQSWLISFIAIIFIRNFLEIFSSHFEFFNIEQFSFIFFHSIAYYTFIFLLGSIFLYFVTGEKIEKIAKLSLFAALLLLLPPILDILVSGGAGVRNIYPFVSQAQSTEFWETVNITLKTSFANPFLGTYPMKSFNSDINFGIRIEVLVLLLGILYYVFLKTKSGLRMLAATFFSYPILYFISFFPYLLAKITNITVFHNISILSPDFSWNYVFFSCYLILISISGSIWFYLYNKEKALALMKNIRLFRAVQIIAVFFFGLYIAGITTVNLKIFDYLVVAMACIALIFYWMAVVLFNDIADVDSDLINSPERPLPSKKFDQKEVKSLATIFLIISYLTSFAISYTFFLLLLLRTCLAYLYSGEPFRLKRFPFLATFVLTLAAFMTILGGYLIVPGKSIQNFPINIFLLILTTFTLGFNAKDVKDYAGDKIEKIYTIPVLFGLERGKKIIGVLSLVCFLLVPIMFNHNNSILWPLSIVAGLISVLLIIRKKYSETPLFLLYFIYATVATLIIF